jgi:tRNA(Ile)-lysidine synthase
LEQKVADFIAAEGLLRPADKVLLAVSGGADSTALLNVMSSLKLAGVLPIQICCAHINHQLRGAEAQRDEEFVVSDCRKLNLPVFAKQIDVKEYSCANKLSIETAARKLRIDALLDIAVRQNCTCIATAHQKNDNAETILQRLSRGTGFRGLCGIWPAKEFEGNIRFVRPLLCASRDEIIQYLNSRNLKWCTDRTNADCAYRRNFIRHRLLPALQENCAGNIVEQLSELATVSRGFHCLICKKADAVWPDVATVDEHTVVLDSGRFADQSPEVKIEIIRRALSRLDAGEQEITQQHYGNIYRLSNGDKLQLPNFIEAYRQGGKIVFGHRQARPQAPNFMLGVNLRVPGKTEFAGMLIEAEIFDFDSARFDKFKVDKSNFIEWLDWDKINPPIMVRFRKNGDRFRPLGLPAEKKVGKFLTDTKISKTLREKLLIVADCEKIIWLCPVRISEQAKVTGRTSKVHQLQLVDDSKTQKEGAAGS